MKAGTRKYFFGDGRQAGAVADSRAWNCIGILTRHISRDELAAMIKAERRQNGSLWPMRVAWN